MASSYIALLGGMNMDLIAQPGAALVMGDSNPGSIRCVPGGVARNVAENLARLGHAVRLVSLVGDDPLGQSLLAHTQAVGVDVSAVLSLAGWATSTYLSIHSQHGEMDFAINDMALLNQLTPAVLQANASLLQGASAWVVDANLAPDTLDYVLGTVLGTAVRRTAVFADAVSVAKCSRLRPWLAKLHTLKVNSLEAQALCGFTVVSRADAVAACQYLQSLGVGQVVISLGADGVVWSDDQGSAGHCPAAPVSVVNVSGAGDALLAGLVHGHQSAWALAQSVEFAVACAEVTLGSASANAPDLTVATVLARQAYRHSAARHTAA
ncbi:MAG: kinase [Burkholderiales bacterium PBB3]|nr:MAG: kinase [Burkholderiales bacterium PBB3]